MPDPAAVSNGYMHMLPFYAPLAMTITHIGTLSMPWHSPGLATVSGTIDASGEPFLGIPYETPTSWVRTAEDIPKFQREWLYMRRFSSDQRLAIGAHAFANVREGSDPPDAFVDTDAGTIGVESAALTIQERRTVNALFVRLRQQLLMQEPILFQKLAGYMIYVWFTDPSSGELAKPFRRTETEAIDFLMRELASYEPRADQLLVPMDSVPEQAPELGLQTTPAGASFYAIPFIGAVPSSMLYTVAGFEIGMVYGTFIAASRAWEIVQKLVDDHDRPGVDILLISAGAPDKSGFIYPAEEALAEFLTQNGPGLARKPDHIKRIILHSWGSGSATALYPERVHMFGPIYGMTVTTHQTILDRTSLDEPPSIEQ